MFNNLFDNLFGFNRCGNSSQNNCGCDSGWQNGCGCGNSSQNNCGCDSGWQNDCGCGNSSQTNCGCDSGWQNDCGCGNSSQTNCGCDECHIRKRRCHKCKCFFFLNY